MLFGSISLGRSLTERIIAPPRYPEDARRELDEGLGRVVDFHEKLRSLAVEAKERLRRPEMSFGNILR
jgi:hypothetical protein